jgi:acetyltransferase-like isoleucine patch superfamily enzyme
MENVLAENKIIGQGLKIASSAYIKCPNVVIGRNVVIDERVKIICKTSVIIGDNVYIGNDVSIILKSFEVGEYTKIHNHSLINGKDAVIIGDNCWFGQNCILNGEALLQIGNNVGVGTYSSVWTHGYFGQLIDGCQIYSIKPTIIEDDAWMIGSYNTIFPGVTVGRQAVLMGTSVVTKSMLPNKIYSGNPAKEISDKIGEPYIAISYSEKKKIIRQFVEDYLNAAKMAFKSITGGFEIDLFGYVLFFDESGESKKKYVEVVMFYDKVDTWEDVEGVSKFCLSEKKYQKRYSEIEILIKTILNPVAARFVEYKK